MSKQFRCLLKALASNLSCAAVFMLTSVITQRYHPSVLTVCAIIVVSFLLLAISIGGEHGEGD